MTPPTWIIFIVALFAVCNHLIAFIDRVTIPRAIAIPRAIGAGVVMAFYGYLYLFPETSLEIRSLSIRWSFILLFLPEGYPITYLLARRQVKHGG